MKERYTNILHMEKRITSKVNEYFAKMKDDIKQYVVENVDLNDKQNDLLKFIYDYEKLSLNKDDFSKRKRVKNTVPMYERCCAKRANGEQCTRRRKDGEIFCGTHIKGTPHGIFNQEDSQEQAKQTVQIWVEDIKGIVYYIDENHNVYDTEDVAANKDNPRVIAKWEKNSEGVYSIPEFDKI